MKLAENEFRRIGMKLEALVELSQERSDAGLEIRKHGAKSRKSLKTNNIYGKKLKQCKRTSSVPQ